MTDEKHAAFDIKVARTLVRRTKSAMKEPILRTLLDGSLLTEAQLETLLIDLVLEDGIGDQIPYEDKASLRSKKKGRSGGVTRGAFNRTLKQARRNVTRCLYTMLLLAYLGFFDFTIFRPFEEVAAKIGGYRKIREVLAGKSELSSEELETYRISENTIIEALENLASPLILKSDLSRRRSSEENNE